MKYMELTIYYIVQQKCKDPLQLPFELHDLIFHHLNASELINASFVSKMWYNFIGQSPYFQNRVAIRFDEFSYGHKRRLENLNVIKNSNRNYKIVHIKNYTAGLEKILFLWIEWKMITVEIHKFSSMTQYYKYLTQFADSVKDLEIVKVWIISKNDCSDKLEFPQLEKLSFKNVSVLAIEPFIKHQKNLKSLNLYLIKKASKPREAIIKDLLIANKDIEELSIGFNFHLFNEDISDKIGLNLKTIILENCLEMEMSSNVLINLQTFLSAQGNSIKFIKLINFNDVGIIFEIWNNMTVLNEITIKYFSLNKTPNFDSNQDLIIKPNYMVKKLNIEMWSVPLSWLKKLLEACPDLEELNISRMSTELMDYVKENSRKLRKINCFCGESVHLGCGDTFCCQTRDIVVQSNFI